MLNRTIGRLCGFFLLTFQPGIRLEFLAFSYFCFLLRREPVSPEVRLTYQLFPPVRVASPDVVAVF